MSKKRNEPKSMPEFIGYTRPDNNLNEYYDEFEGAGPIERAELRRCRDIDRRIESYVSDADYNENEEF